MMCARRRTSKGLWRLGALLGGLMAMAAPAQALSVPTAVTGLASGVTQISANVTGTVNPEGLESSYHYQYGTSTEYGRRTDEAQAGAGSSPISVPWSLADLAPATTYHYRLVSEDEAGASLGEDQQFTTASYSLPGVFTGPAGAISANTASIVGSVNPQGIRTVYELQIGTDANYGAEIFGNAGEAGADQSLELGVASLQPDTTYHYRLLARNAAGTSYGADRSFTTAAVASSITSPLTPPQLAIPAIVVPVETVPATRSARPLTNAQKLAKALKACKQQRKSKRAACEGRARKRYGSKQAKRS